MAGRLPVEALSVPVALLALGGGTLELRRRPDRGSWYAYGVGLLAGLGPPLLLTFVGGDTPARRALLAAGAVAVVAVGLSRGQRAPLVIGAATLAIAVERELAVLTSPWVALAALAAPVVAVAAVLGRRSRLRF
ncbi:hypothetical protein ABZS66_55280 [Dactylosporangium sp. NPDC005572]|uniref:SCO7613 C-terminal domain-containing membrane protein n=1 Tax=Dactylosporangium sp. NPDC005572 TaxID=3156889 RepID=UPI0033A79224